MSCHAYQRILKLIKFVLTIDDYNLLMYFLDLFIYLKFYLIRSR